LIKSLNSKKKLYKSFYYYLEEKNNWLENRKVKWCYLLQHCKLISVTYLGNSWIIPFPSTWAKPIRPLNFEFEHL
jgi:hypothetical protein